MVEDRDSARLLLAASKEEMAKAGIDAQMYYLLLCTKLELQYPQEEEFPDSTIALLIDYYTHSNEKPLLAEAYLLAAKVYFLQIQDSEKALHFCDLAEDLARQLKNSLLMAKIYEQKSSIYPFLDDKDQTIDCLTKLYDLYTEQRDTLNMIRIKDEISRERSWRNPQYDRLADIQKTVRQVRRFGKAHADMYLIMEAMEYRKRHMPDSALSILRSLDAFQSENPTVDGIIGDVFEEMRQLDSASFYYKRGYDGDLYTHNRIQFLTGLIRVEDARGNISLADRYRSRLEEMNDSLDNMNTKALNEVRSLLMEKSRSVFALNASSQRKSRVFYAIALGGLVLLMIALWYIWKTRSQQEDLRKHFHQMERIKGGEKDDVKEMLCLREMKGTRIYGHIQNIIHGSSEKMSDRDWEDLAAAVDQVYAGFTSRLNHRCKLNIHEYHVCLLLKIRVSPIDIARLTLRSKEAITATRRRLYERNFGKKGRPRDWDEYIEKL